jgi:hypothetical protein
MPQADATDFLSLEPPAYTRLDLRPPTELWIQGDLPGSIEVVRISTQAPLRELPGATAEMFWDLIKA